MKFLHAIAILLLVTSCASKTVMKNCIEASNDFFICDKP